MTRAVGGLRSLLTEAAELVPLKSVGKWYGGGTPSSTREEFWENGTIPWLSPKDMGRAVVDRTQDHITELAIRSSATKLVPANSVAVVVRSSILERVLPSALVPMPVTLNQDMRAVVTHEAVLPGYLAHVIRSRGPELLRTVRKTGGSVASIDVPKLMEFRVPVPSLDAQREIVRVLDSFTQLEAELEAELEARRRQYTHYRDALLTFANGDGKCQWRPFGDIATIVRGASPRPIQSFLTTSEDGVPWIRIGDVDAAGKFITSTAEKISPAGVAASRQVKVGDFVLSNSMSFGRPYILGIDGCIHDGWLAISEFSGSFLHDFLYHLLRSSGVYAQMVQKASSGTVSNLNADVVRRLRLPVPPLAEQARIVAILDAFDALVNDLSSGLPAEIAARRRQYEHYRDRLLTFPESA